MRRLALFSLPLVLLGGACLPDAREAAVRVEVTYNFKAGCITVLARDAETPSREASTELEVLERGPATVTLAVFREQDWSHKLEITTEAHEQTCAGPVVARDVSTVELRKARVESLPVTLEATDEDGDGYVIEDDGGTDCNDKLGSIHPHVSEVCDGQDNDCDGTVDQGAGFNWYPDRDGDGFGDRDAVPLVSCTAPSGPPTYVKDGTDCRDSDAEAFPRAGVSETRCDDIDDDCDGVPDDGFPLKGSACSDPCPGGQYICNPGHTGLACQGPAPIPVFTDDDGDGAGKEGSTSVGQICPGAQPSAGTSDNTADCDDLDPNNRRGRSEVCDGRDNTCDTTADEGDVCQGKGWKVLADPALTGSRQWKTVALGAGGFPVWVAGSGGALAVRVAAGQAFRSLDGNCGTHNWLSAWVRPTDGVVFLASDAGQVAQHDGTACSNSAVNFSTFPITGIISFPATTTIYLVNSAGRLSTWVPGTTPVEVFNLTPPVYYGIHGLAPSLLLGVGGIETAPNGPYANSYIGTGTVVQDHTLTNLPVGYAGYLRAVWMGGPRLAYAVGDDGVAMKWDGVTTWTRVAAPPDNATADFTSVVVLDPSSVYSTDATGVLRRLTATGWISAPVYTSDQPLRDIAATSPGDIWAVGDNGKVVHFPE